MRKGHPHPWFIHPSSEMKRKASNGSSQAGQDRGDHVSSDYRRAHKRFIDRLWERWRTCHATRYPIRERTHSLSTTSSLPCSARQISAIAGVETGNHKRESPNKLDSSPSSLPFRRHWESQNISLQRSRTMISYNWVYDLIKRHWLWILSVCFGDDDPVCMYACHDQSHTPSWSPSPAAHLFQFTRFKSKTLRREGPWKMYWFFGFGVCQSLDSRKQQTHSMVFPNTWFRCNQLHTLCSAAGC